MLSIGLCETLDRAVDPLQHPHSIDERSASRRGRAFLGGCMGEISEQISQEFQLHRELIGRQRAGALLQGDTAAAVALGQLPVQFELSGLGLAVMQMLQEMHRRPFPVEFEEGDIIGLYIFQPRRGAEIAGKTRSQFHVGRPQPTFRVRLIQRALDDIQEIA